MIIINKFLSCSCLLLSWFSTMIFRIVDSMSILETTKFDRNKRLIYSTVQILQGNDIDEEPEALSMAWPDTNRKRLTYLLVAPILFPLWLTLPDTRTPKGKKWFPVTFIGSIVWIAAYSYLMVWWANVAGDTAQIPPEVSEGRRMSCRL